MDGPVTKESADIRRAFDLLQQTLEVLSDRYRERRKERKQLRSRIDELEQDREKTALATAARLETAVIDRKRVTELEERVVQAERRNSELYDRISDLQAAVSEREGLIADQ